MKKFNFRSVNRAFTLLELLVVIGIIGILVSLITVSFSSAQKSARDSRRRQDLTSMQNAMEQYYAANNFVYPVCNCTKTASGDACCASLNAYYSDPLKPPLDPLNTVGFQYDFSNGTTSTYKVTANMERGAAVSVFNLQ